MMRVCGDSGEGGAAIVQSGREGVESVTVERKGWWNAGFETKLGIGWEEKKGGESGRGRERGQLCRQ